jgi:hypothetical protein
LLQEEQAQLRSKGTKPLVYWPAKRGVAEVAAARGMEITDLDWNPRQHEVGALFLDHLLDINRTFA